MSNIPEARRILQEALDAETPHEHIREALKLLDRSKPTFITPRRIAPLSEDSKAMAVCMRRAGQPLNDIARALGTNIGRVSEAINAVGN